jgi:hypothetical protein
MTFTQLALASTLLLGGAAIVPARADGPASKPVTTVGTAPAAAATAAGVSKQHVAGGDDEVRNEQERLKSKALK